MSTGLMHGKRGLIMGLANDKSIAWGIATGLAEHGAEMAFSYQGEALKKRVEPLDASIGMSEMLECDVADEASMDDLFAASRDAVGQDRFPRPRHRLFRQERTARPLRRHLARQLPHDDGHLGLFLHRRLPARRSDDARRRRAPDPDLLRRRKGHAALQRHGPCQGRAGSLGAVHRRRPRQGRHPRATPSRPARSRRWPPRASATSATS